MTGTLPKSYTPPAGGPLNSRWVACGRALGGKFSVWQFQIWMSEQWREFAALHGVRTSDEVFLKLGEHTHKDFDTWLEAKTRG